jgi:hypothetical protein
MKEKELFVDFEAKQLILYAEKEDGTYGPIKTGSHMVKNYLDDYWYKLKNLENYLSEKLTNNEVSSIYYYMILSELTIAELAARVGFRKRKVKRHLNHRAFGTIKVKELQRYAEVFDVPLANFFQIIMYQEKEGMKSFFIKDTEPELINIRQTETKNGNIVLTEIFKRDGDN